MRRLTIAILVGCLLGAGAGTAAAAQSPSPGPPYPDPIEGVRVYDHAGVLSDDTVLSVEATLGAIEERTGADIVVYTQVKPESDTPEEAVRDAVSLTDQWEVGQADGDAGLAILFDLEPNLCHGQVQLYAAPGYAAAYLTNEERQAIFEQDMLPALRDCDLDAALLAAIERIDAATRHHPASGQFGPGGSLAEARYRHTATALTGGRVLVVGGRDEDGVSALAEVWDPVTGTFSPAGSLAEARWWHTATPLPDGRVLAVGGWDSVDGPDAYLASAEVWDPANASFSPAGSLAEARRSHAATPLPDGRVLVVGGEYYFNVLASAEVWDPARTSFSPAGSLAEVRQGHTATPLSDGRVLVLGGLSGDYEELLASAEVWDPVTAAFSPAGSLAEARSAHTATPLSDGRVLVVGGAGEGGILASAEVWDPATASFSPAGSLSEARIYHTATALPDGRVLVVGGMDKVGVSLASAEVWDPATGTFGPTGSLVEARYWHTGTPLPDGRVLVVGGRDTDGALALAELWEPSGAAP